LRFSLPAFGELSAADLEKINNKRFEDVNARLDSHFLLLLALVGFIGVVIGIPPILVALQRKNQRAQNKKIEAQQQQIETLLKEIETLKQQRIFGS